MLLGDGKKPEQIEETHMNMESGNLESVRTTDQEVLTHVSQMEA